MIKLITTVGTSLFENYRKEKKDIEGYYFSIKDVNYGEYDEYSESVAKIRNTILNYYGYYNKDKKVPDHISAEIKSIKKIKKYLKDRDIEVYLVATDTVVSCEAANIIRLFLEKDEFKVNFTPAIDVIKGLQIKDKEVFVNQGLTNLIRRIENISGGCYENVAFNISGGYKATIPYMTLMAQINGCYMYYIFEDTEELIVIPPGPITTDDELFEKYYKEFVEIEGHVDNYAKWKESRYEFVSKAMSCIEVCNNIAGLSPFGEILWKNYKNRYSVFFATDEVIGKIKNNETLAKKVVKFLSEDNIREGKTEIKGSKIKHKVYDDGNNDYRIVYVQKDNQFYIYAIFDYEPDEIKFLNNPKQSNNVEDYNFRLYRINKRSLEVELLE